MSRDVLEWLQLLIELNAPEVRPVHVEALQAAAETNRLEIK